MNKTIQQQLEAVGHQLTVDGIEFNAEFYEGDHDGYYFLIGRKKVEIFWELETSGQTQFNKWILKYGAVFGGTPLDVHFTAPTIEAACLEALRLCREKISELGKALGMGVIAPESDAVYTEHFLNWRDKYFVPHDPTLHLLRWQPKNKTTLSNLSTTKQLLAQYTKAMLQSPLLNQPTGENK